MNLTQACVYLIAAVLAVPLAKRLGLGSVLGYLLAGIVIGPFVLNVAGESDGVMHFAEFGVVMMLFLIGLELRPARLWELRRTVFGMGTLQVVCTALLAGAVAVACGNHWKPAIAIGLMLAMSSTAIVLQSLNEKGLLKTPGGEAAFSVLLCQDIAVIPILAILPMLASFPKQESKAHAGGELSGLAAWNQGLLVLGAVVVLVIAGRYLLRPVLRYIADTRLREMFTATTLLLVIGIGLLMERVGLSPALGTFLAGVLLAESEYRVQLETDLEPFKGLLLGLFFISVGASVDFQLIARQPLTIGLIVLGLVAIKLVVLYAIGRFFRLEKGQSYLFAFALAQGGEFAFVLISFGMEQGVLPHDLAALLVAAVALSMACAPILITFNDRVVKPRFQVCPAPREADKIDENDNPVVLAGFGRFGNVVGRLLRANGFGTTSLDHDPDQVETLRRFGLKSFYGDASRLDLLHAAGVANAKLFVLAIDDEAKALQIVRMLQNEYPKLPLLVRAASRQHAYELLRLGVRHIYRETLGSALDLGFDALRALDVSEERARRAVEIFREHDEASVREMAAIGDDDEEAYASTAAKHIENLARALQADREGISPGESETPEAAEASP